MRRRRQTCLNPMGRHSPSVALVYQMGRDRQSRRSPAITRLLARGRRDTGVGLRMRRVGLGAAGLAVLLASAPALAAGPEITGSIGSQTRLPVPRFVSLKSERVNARMGPTRDHQVIWIYQRSGLPVEITAEFENWRRIRDHEGTETWVFHSMLSGKRTGMVRAEGNDAALVPVMNRAGGDRVVARVEPRVQGTVRTCNGTWCRFVGDGFDGWIEQNRLWGVYPGERID